jgi:outer membrane immunogenic protein
VDLIMTLKLRCFATIVALAAAAPAFAADLPMAAPLPPPILFSWTGCYIGAHVGGAISQDRTTSSSGNSVDFSSTGFVGGGQIGCDAEFAPNWVMGAEARAAWSSLKNTHPAAVRNPVTGATFPSRFTFGDDFLASVTTRLGYGFSPGWLAYARGGGAWTRQKVDDAYTKADGVAIDPSATMTRAGWTAGAGVEWAFAPHWSANLEYNYYDFGAHGFTLTSANGNVSVNSLKDTIHAVTAGVNYRF